MVWNSGGPTCHKDSRKSIERHGGTNAATVRLEARATGGLSSTGSAFAGRF